MVPSPVSRRELGRFLRWLRDQVGPGFPPVLRRLHSPNGEWSYEGSNRCQGSPCRKSRQGGRVGHTRP